MAERPRQIIINLEEDIFQLIRTLSEEKATSLSSLCRMFVLKALDADGRISTQLLKDLLFE